MFRLIHVHVVYIDKNKIPFMSVWRSWLLCITSR